MFKSSLGLLSVLCFAAGCTAPSSSVQPQAAAGQSAAVGTVDSAPAQSNDDYETVFVPPPVGSLLGGGAVRVAKRNIVGNDENALLGNISRLNAAAGATAERPFVINAVSRVTGVSERELQAQQDRLQLRFGELCAINAIAHGNSSKVQQIAAEKSKGQSWTDLARANGLSIASVVQVAQNANEMTANAYTSSAERRKGGENKLKQMGVRPAVPPGS